MPSILYLTAHFLVATADINLPIDPIVEVYPLNGAWGSAFVVPRGGQASIPLDLLPAYVHYRTRWIDMPDTSWIVACGTDVNLDGNCGTDADIDAFWEALGSGGGSADFDGDGHPGTDADIEAFYRALGGG